MMRYLEKETRPWGKFFVIEENENYKIKRIEVEPGHRLSYQYHTRRSETWIIIMGKCKITIDDLKNNNQKGDVVQIPRGTKHRVENIGKQKLVFVEIQTGEYFGEDDIIRIQDDYKRK